MIRIIKEALHPSGRTTQNQYRLSSALLLITSYLLWLVMPPPPQVGFWLAGLVTIVFFTLLILLTIRRLRDAGWSPWWAMLLVVHVTVGGLEWPVLPPLIMNWASIYKLLPLLIGWFAPGVEADEQAA